ncbi:hypothetical protein [Streptomyces sp. NPDC004783]|uniref:hypothetical protein n=1 Tax=Streptomyces sp. NPDC004783 TaxID=3154459 RepID=UPI0033AC9631
MENRIGQAAPGRTTTTQADEALRRARNADTTATAVATTDRQNAIRQMIAARSGRNFLAGIHAMTTKLPSQAGLALRITVTVIDTGEDVGTVDVDSVNADDLGNLAARRAATFHAKPTPAPNGKPALRLVGGGR